MEINTQSYGGAQPAWVWGKRDECNSGECVGDRTAFPLKRKTSGKCQRLAEGVLQDVR